jgi:hypothetical protein
MDVHRERRWATKTMIVVVVLVMITGAMVIMAMTTLLTVTITSMIHVIILPEYHLMASYFLPFYIYLVGPAASVVLGALEYCTCVLGGIHR